MEKVSKREDQGLGIKESIERKRYVEVWEPGVIVLKQVTTVVISPLFSIDYISKYLNYPQDIYIWINTKNMHIQT